MIHSCRRSARRTPSKHKTRPASPSEESSVSTSDAVPLNSFVGSSPDLVKDFENVQRQRQQQQQQQGKESEHQEKGKTSTTKANNKKKKKKKKATTVKLKKETEADTISMGGKDGHGSGDDDDEAGKPNRSGKSRRELPTGAVATLKAWLLSPEHFTHPYPTPQDQIMLMQKTGIDKKQLKNWFTNARRRIWKPMLKKQLEQGKLTATGAGGGGVAVPGVVPGLMLNPMGTTPAHPGAELAGAPSDNAHSTQPIHTHYQPAIQPPAPHAQPQQQVSQRSLHFVAFLGVRLPAETCSDWNSLSYDHNAHNLNPAFFASQLTPPMPRDGSSTISTERYMFSPHPVRPWRLPRHPLSNTRVSTMFHSTGILRLRHRLVVSPIPVRRRCLRLAMHRE